MAKIDKWLEHAKEHFAPGEDALASVLGVYQYEFMERNILCDEIVIATNQRLLFYTKKLFGFDLKSIPYDNISSLEMGKVFRSYCITFNFFEPSNSTKTTWIKAGDIPAFMEVVKAQKEASKTSAATPALPTADDPVSQLERLGKLHTSGVLTDTEFESKKAEILARM